MTLKLGFVVHNHVSFLTLTTEKSERERQSLLDFPSFLIFIGLRSLYTRGRVPAFPIHWRPCACVPYTLESVCLRSLYTGGRIFVVVFTGS